MSSVPSAVSGVVPVVSSEVVQYARQHGIEPTLQQLVAVTPVLYPTAESIEVYLEQDVEDDQLWFLVFEVRVPQTDVPDYLAAHNRWTAEWQKAYPCPRNHHVILDLIPVAL